MTKLHTRIKQTALKPQMRLG